MLDSNDYNNKCEIISKLRSKALNYLSRREYSYLELLHKLSNYFSNQADIIQVLDTLVKDNLLSEQRYVESYLRRNKNKYSWMYLKRHLQLRVKDTSVLEDVISNTIIEDLSTAQQIWEKKFGVKAKESKDLAKQIRCLQSKGFSLDIIKQIVF